MRPASIPPHPLPRSKAIDFSVGPDLLVLFRFGEPGKVIFRISPSRKIYVGVADGELEAVVKAPGIIGRCEFMVVGTAPNWEESV